MRKLSKIGLLFLAVVFLLTFFSSIRVMVLYYYHLQQAYGNYDLAMRYMDKANIFNFTSFITGWLYGWIVVIMIFIIKEK